MKHGHFLFEWKIRHRIRLDGNSNHIRSEDALLAGTCGHNNRHWPKGTPSFLPNTETIRMEEDLQFQSFRDYIYGIASLFENRFAGKNASATEQDLQDAMKLIRCWPEMSWFLRRRLERSHPRHYRHSNCIKNLWDTENSKWGHAMNRAARSRNGNMPQPPPEWHKPLLFETTVSVYVIDAMNEHQEPYQAQPFQAPAHGSVYTFTVPEFLTLDRFLNELYYAMYNTRSHGHNTLAIQKLWIYRDPVRNKSGFPRVFQKEAIINDLDFYRKTTLFEHTKLLSPAFGIWFKAVLHWPLINRELTVPTVPVTNPLARYKTIKAYMDLTKIVLPSELPQPRDPARRSKVARLPTESWIERGYHHRVRYTADKIENPRKESHVYSSASEADSEDEEPDIRRAKNVAWEAHQVWARQQDQIAIDWAGDDNNLVLDDE